MLFRSIRTSVAYPGNKGTLIEYAAQEQDAETRPALTSQIENLEEYDIVYVGYPNWWYDMPMVMYSFFDAYDFSGKTVIPFNTHNGSGLSGTVQTIANLEPEAIVLEGYTVHQDRLDELEAALPEWLRKIGQLE